MKVANESMHSSHRSRGIALAVYVHRIDHDHAISFELTIMAYFLNHCRWDMESLVNVSVVKTCMRFVNMHANHSVPK